MSKKFTPPPKEPCSCKAFCLEDLARTGRYCKLEAARSGNAGVSDMTKDRDTK
jgi:hypothetical protein